MIAFGHWSGVILGVYKQDLLQIQGIMVILGLLFPPKLDSPNDPLFPEVE